ncbi:MAG: carboxypeptidase regulatory-like domain-containing protein [Terriglobales bacterium]
MESTFRSTRTLVLLACVLLAFAVAGAFAQETTGGLQGTVKDPSGAVVSHAKLELTSSSMVGKKVAETDGSGYYRFANLPPGTYSVTVTAQGFSTEKRDGLVIEVGHLPTVDLKLAVGTSATVVEVTGAAPVIDTTTNTNQTNITSEALDDTPHGYSFQSVIQYAPMARNEPLAGNTNGGMGAGGGGGNMPGSSGNGLAVGFSVGGGADSENSYLVEGQDTENISGGASNANVPFQFIQEVQVKSSGIEAEHGGALGGVVNVVMKKGSNAIHGAIFGTYESSGMDGSPNGTLRYDPLQLVTTPDIDSQTYLPRRDHFKTAEPGFTLGGPLVKDRVWFFLGFAPEYNSTARTVNFDPEPLCTTLGGCPNSALGNQVFTQDNQQYFGTARIDAYLTQKIRLFGSWLYQYARESGDTLPGRDPINAQSATYLNESIFTPFAEFSHGLGFSAPNSTYNFGADLTLTPKIVATTRFGYYFNNYHDFGWPTSGVNLDFYNGGLGGLDNYGNPLPASLQVPGGTTTGVYDGTYTLFNANKHYQFDEDVAFFKGGRAGTHNIKAGYQLNHLSNIIDQNGNIPFAFVYLGNDESYGSATAFGGQNCNGPTTGAITTGLAGEWGGNCAGQYGYVTIQDFATILKTPAGNVVPAADTNHALFVQDAWTIGHGLTLNLGLRIERETLPAPAGIGVQISSINFGWSDKIEPRLGAAWGSKSGKMKIFGSYGVTNDVMKLLLAQTSWGAQGYEDCTYPLNPDAGGGFSVSDINTIFNSSGRACPTGVSNVGANFPNNTPPQSLSDAATGVQLIENVNYRPEEPVAPNVKPYRQHEYVGGVDYQVRRDWAFEARYDRRRLDHVIEDASLADKAAFEIYTIVNPGQGVNSTLNGYANYLTSIGDAYGPGTAAFNGDPNEQFGTCTGCPPNPLAIRDYDGLELRLTKTTSKGWAGMFSYTWSRLWGNYTGLTTTDQIDGGTTGRNSPDTTRAFDEPFYYFGANGKSNDGPLPTDRPSALKGNVYYSVPWKGMTTTFGIFQVAYEGSPVSSYADIGYGNGNDPVEATYVWGRGNWINATSDANGNTILGNTYARRTPWYTQTDFNFTHAFKVNKNNDHQLLTFNGTFTNLLNQHSVTSYWGSLNSDIYPSALFQYQIFGAGAAFYQQVETGYNAQAAITASGVPLNSQYGQPNLWQISRHIRLGLTFSF